MASKDHKDGRDNEGHADFIFGNVGAKLDRFESRRNDNRGSLSEREVKEQDGAWKMI